MYKEALVDFIKLSEVISPEELEKKAEQVLENIKEILEKQAECGDKHPGFKAVQKKIMAQGHTKEEAGAILASRTRKASAKAKAENPNLKKVKKKADIDEEFQEKQAAKITQFIKKHPFVSTVAGVGAGAAGGMVAPPIIKNVQDVKKRRVEADKNNPLPNTTSQAAQFQYYS